MPSYIEGDKFFNSTIGTKKVKLKPILFADYETITKYNIKLTYEDDTYKDIELITNDSSKPYKFIFKKNGKLFEVIGIPKVVEINEGSKYCDLPNRTMDSKDLLFSVDISEKFKGDVVKFYLKDIRDIVDLVEEGLYPPDDDSDEVVILNGGDSNSKY